jgi:Fe-Mn family superoxide dismutase
MDALPQAYITNLNKAMAGKPAASLVSLMPDAKKNKINNAGGGHYNHCLLWTSMGPKAGGAPTGDLAKKMDEAFGSYDGFKTQFSAAAAGVFGAPRMPPRLCSRAFTPLSSPPTGVRSHG